MREASSGSSAGQIEADSGEVESKGPMEAGSACASWTDEKHMLYLRSLEESFVNQLYSSQFHLHFVNLLGRKRTNQRQPDSSITTENLSEASQLPQQGRWDDLKFGKTKSRIRKENTSSPLSDNQWYRHFAPNCQVVDCQSSTMKSIKRESCCSSESTSQTQLFISSPGCTEYEEVTDQNFINGDITGAKLSPTSKKKRLSSPDRPLNDQVFPSGEKHHDTKRKWMKITGLMHQT